MNDMHKTKSQLIQELESLRKEVKNLKQDNGLGAVLTSIDDMVFFINSDGVMVEFISGALDEFAQVYSSIFKDPLRLGPGGKSSRDGD